MFLFFFFFKFIRQSTRRSPRIFIFTINYPNFLVIRYNQMRTNLIWPSYGNTTYIVNDDYSKTTFPLYPLFPLFPLYASSDEGQRTFAFIHCIIYNVQLNLYLSKRIYHYLFNLLLLSRRISLLLFFFFFFLFTFSFHGVIWQANDSYKYIIRTSYIILRYFLTIRINETCFFFFFQLQIRSVYRQYVVMDQKSL